MPFSEQQIERAAKALYEEGCRDYPRLGDLSGPWEQCAKKVREQCKRHATAVLRAALSGEY